MTVAHPQLAAVSPRQISIINKASNATIANVLFPSLFKIKNFHKHHKGLTHKREKTFNCPTHFHSKESKKKKQIHKSLPNIHAATRSVPVAPTVPNPRGRIQHSRLEREEEQKSRRERDGLFLATPTRGGHTPSPRSARGAAEHTQPTHPPCLPHFDPLTVAAAARLRRGGELLVPPPLRRRGSAVSDFTVWGWGILFWGRGGGLDL